MISTEKTLVEVMAVLRKRGYTKDFNLLEENLSYDVGGPPVELSDIVIDKSYRFASGNDPEDEAIMYAMRNVKDGAKGVFVNAYGIYSDPNADRVIARITVQEDDSDDWCRADNPNC